MGVRIEELWKLFGSHAAVRGVSAEIDNGEFFVLLGPSGCGKTTTLRMIAGLEKPSAGRVYFDETDVTFRQPRGRDIAMVFQDYGLYPHLSAADNIMFPLKIAGIPKAERRRRAFEVAERLEISSLLRRKPPAISGGEKQRVALARALVRNPKVFLMDEPLSNLDAKLRVSMRAEIKRLGVRIRHHDYLRHTRSNRGDGVGDTHWGDESRRVGPGRNASRYLRQTCHEFRGWLHRLARHEHV